MIRSALHRAQPLVGAWPGHTWILGYHLVGAGTGLVIDISRETFQEHLALLAERTHVISLRQLVRELRGGGAAGAADAGLEAGAALTRPRVVLTFDDAFSNFDEVILPVLLERSLPATLYVPPGFINGEGNHPFYNARFAHVRPMTWERLREAVGAGVEIGSHTYRHTNLARLAAPDLMREFRRAKEEIEERLGVGPASVCYPEGFVTKAVVRVAGRFHESGVVGGGRPVRLAPTGRPRRHEDLLCLPRLPIRADLSAETLLQVLDQSVFLEEWAADKARRLRARVVARA